MSNNALEQQELFRRIDTLEQDRLERDRLERDRLEYDRLEWDRLERDRLEYNRLEWDRVERGRLERDRLERPKSVSRSGSESGNAPSKIGFEGVSQLSKNEKESVNPKSGLESHGSSSKIAKSADSPSKNELESLEYLDYFWNSGFESHGSPSKIGKNADSPSKHGLESFKSLPKSDPVAHGDSTHIISPEIHVTLSIYDRTGAYQRSCIIEVDRDATILELTHRVHQQTGVSLDQMKLFHDGSLLQDLWNDQDRLGACNINESTILTLVLRDPIDGQIHLSTTPKSTTKVEAKDEVQSTSDDYDEDLYIMDPQAHFDMLRQLERNVLQRSEYYQTKREYSLSNALDPVDEGGLFLDEIGLQPSLAERIRRSSIMTQVSIHLVSIDFLSRSPSKNLAFHLRDIPIGDCWLIANRQVR